MQTFEEMLNIVKNRSNVKKQADKMGQELAADIVEFMKAAELVGEDRKEYNKQRISALGLKLIQGGKV